MVLNIPGLSAHQRDILSDFDKALRFYLEHEKQTEGVTLKAVLDRAGIDSYASFDYVVKMVGGKNIPEANEVLNSVRERLETLGLTPTVFKYVRRPQKTHSAPQELKLEVETLPPAEHYPKKKVNLDKLAVEADEACDEITVWNICTKALMNLHQRQRETVHNSVGNFLGLGVV